MKMAIFRVERDLLFAGISVVNGLLLKILQGFRP